MFEVYEKYLFQASFFQDKVRTSQGVPYLSSVNQNIKKSWISKQYEW